MEEKFKYVFDDASKILYKHYYGPITLDNIFDSWDYAIANSIIPKETKGFILDYREAYFNIKITDYVKIAEYYKNHLEVFGNYKIAVVTQSAKDVALPTLVESKDDGYLSRPFFTMDAAIRWVLNGQD